MGRWYPIELGFQYRAFAEDHPVQAGTGRTVEISSRALRIRLDDELPPQVSALQLAIAWPATLEGGTPLQWVVRGKPAWRATGWIFVCMTGHEFRTASVRARQAATACG